METNKLSDFFSAFGKEPKCDTDARIMSKINRWRTKQTQSYYKFTSDGGSDIGYLAHMFARTGVAKDAAKLYIFNLSGLSGSIEDFDSEYADTKFEEKFRELVTK